MNTHRNSLYASVLSLALVLPAAASAAMLNTIDTVAGIATEVVIEDLAPATQVELSVTSPLGESFTHTLNVGEHGIAHTWLAGADLQIAGTYDLQMIDALGNSTDSTLTVHPDSVDPLRSTVEIAKAHVDVGEEVVATVILMDRFGNALSARPTELLSSRPDDLVQAITRETDLYGEQQFIVRAATPGELSLRTVDLISGETLKSATVVSAGTTLQDVGGPERQVAYTQPQPNFYRGNPYSANLLRDPNPYRAQANDPPRLEYIDITIIGQEGEPMPTVEQYKAESMLLTAIDQYGNPYYDFTGTIYLATTDPEATLPSFGVYNFLFEDEGQKMLTLGLKFAAEGIQTMVLTERPDEIPSDLTQALGHIDINVTPKKIVITEEQKMQIVSPKEGAILNTTDILVEGRGPPFINIVVSGGTEDVESETDRQGNYSVGITLDGSSTEHTITVKDSDTPQNFTERTVTVDVIPPKIGTITFTPEDPIEGTDVLVVVETEPNLNGISLEFNGETIDMATNDPTATKYQALISADDAGTYEVKISATDAQGNTGEKTDALRFGLRGLDQVQNVIAEAQINAIALRWDPIEDDDIDAYRIYVGTSADEFLYTLDTDRPTAAATVAGLRPGTTYYFGVTALEGERESELKSDIVSAIVLGLNLDVSPSDGSLFIEWTELESNVPLSTFLLEYGLDENNLSEQRILNGQLRAYTLRDLINGIGYHLKLTPIATNGESLTDLAATGQGTPIGPGFTAGTADPVPFELRASAPPGSDPIPRPVTQIPLSEEGVPMWMLFSIVGITIFTFHVHLRRKRNHHQTVAFTKQLDALYRP